VVLSTSSLGSKYTVSRRPDTPTRLDRKCLEANELTGAMIARGTYFGYLYLGKLSS
jgi:hypothetical protein